MLHLNLCVGLIYLIENYCDQMIIILILLCSPYCHFDWSGTEWRNLFWMFVFFIGVFILAFYFNGRMGDPSTALRVTIRILGFGLIFVICVIAAVGDV